MRKAKTASPGCRRFESTKRPEAESFRVSHLKTTRKRGFFMSKREFLLSARPEQATFVACVGTRKAEQCFCLRTIKRERQSARPGFFVFTNLFPPIKNAPLRGVGKNQTATLVNYILAVFHYTTVGAFPAEPFAKPNKVFRGGTGNFAAQAA